MPTPRKGESEKSYVRRCVPVVIREGTAKDGSQAAAICHSMYRRRRAKTRSRRMLTAKSFCTPFGGEVMVQLGSRKANRPSRTRIYLRAYTGKPISVENFEYPVLIDLAGARFDKTTTPVIADHKTNNRIGHTIEQVLLRANEKGEFNGQRVYGPLVAAVGLRSSNMEVAKGFERDAKAGFPFQVSIGATIVRGYVLEDGDTVEANGRVWEGPLIVARRSVIRELSVTVLGADNDTSAMVVAAKAKLRENEMSFQAWVKSLGLVLAKLKTIQKKRLKAQYDELAQSKAKVKRRALVKAGTGGDDPPEGDDDDDAATGSNSGNGEGDKDGGGGNKGRRRRLPGIKAKVKRVIRSRDDDDDNEDIDARISRTIEATQNRLESIANLTAEFQDQIETIEVGEGDKAQELTLKEFRAYAVRRKMSPEHYELQLRRAALPVLDGGPAIQVVNKSIDAKALECAILRANGVEDSMENLKTGRQYGLDSMFNDEVLEASHDRRYQLGNSIDRLLSLQVMAAGSHTSHLSGGDLFVAAHSAWSRLGAKSEGFAGREFRGSGFSTLNIVNILENTMHKAAFAAFEGVESVWRMITRIMSLNDFKVHNLYRLDWSGHFRKVATDGELKHLSMVDSKKTIQAETFGAMITIDRKTRANDDLGMVVEQARQLGMLGALRVEEALFVLWLSNPGSFYSAGNNNLITGGGTVLGIDSFTTAKQKFRDQVINGRPISVSPSVLLVGTNNEILANRLYKQTRMEVTTTANVPQFADNPHVGWVIPVVTGWLNNTSITDQDGKALTGQSTTHWALFAPPNAPQGGALVIGFKDGRQTPFFDEAETQFNIPGGIQMRGYFDFGTAMHVTQMSLKSAGA